MIGLCCKYLFTGPEYESRLTFCSSYINLLFVPHVNEINENFSQPWWKPISQKSHENRTFSFREITSSINNEQTNQQTDKPVGDWISTPSPNVVAMATRLSPTTFCIVPLNRPSPKTPSMCKHLRSICHTCRVIGDFLQTLDSKFWALQGTISKIEDQLFVDCRGGHGELTAKKWLDSIEKQKKKKQFEVCDRLT